MVDQSPIRMLGAYQPIVVGELNGKKAYFLIDTGADVTMLNSMESKKYNYETRPWAGNNYKLSGLNIEHQGEIRIAKNVELVVGGRKMKGSYKAIDLTHIVSSIAGNGSIRIAGIIGSDMMRRHDFVINYKARNITFAAN
ncbi:hypothetical protein [Reichenbachiella sp. MALMAid0571]|uniref:hypothetical protein n=1 Tax=Reichenbachiella sp. MALMAid0571 TaxID=3143939 RepID=UPI0032DE2D88